MDFSKKSRHSAVNLWALALLLSIFLFHSSWALSTNSQQKMKSSKTLKPVKSETQKLSLFFNISRSQSWVDHKDGTRAEEIGLIGSAGYLIEARTKLGFLLLYNQDLRDSEKSDFSDAQISLSRLRVNLGKHVALAPGVFVALPTSRDSRERQEFQGALGVNCKLGFQEGTWIPGFSLGFMANLSKNFHKYQTSIDGKVNNEYFSLQRMDLEYSWNRWSLSGLFLHFDGFTYGGNVRESFAHFEEIGFELTPSWSLGLGHTNGGSALKANGQDNNILLFNENSSMAYLSLSGKY